MKDYKQFKKLEKAHEEGVLINICSRCGNPFKPKLRTYNKNTFRLKETPIIKFLKNGKIRVDKYIKLKNIVGNWMSLICNECRSKAEKDRRKYKEHLKSTRKKKK